MNATKTETLRTSSLKDNRDGTATVMMSIHYSDRSHDDTISTGLYDEMRAAEKKFYGRRKPRSA